MLRIGDRTACPACGHDDGIVEVLTADKRGEVVEIGIRHTGRTTRIVTTSWADAPRATREQTATVDVRPPFCVVHP